MFSQRLPGWTYSVSVPKLASPLPHLIRFWEKIFSNWRTASEPALVEVIVMDKIYYDGAITRDGALDWDVKAAIREVRAWAIAVIIITGRILSGLRKAAGELDFVDAVVAENGAVLAFPDGNSRLIAQPAPAIFIEEIHRLGNEFLAGQSVVETDASAAPAISDTERVYRIVEDPSSFCAGGTCTAWRFFPVDRRSLSRSRASI